MPHVYQPQYTREIPTKAERVKHKDGAAVRWKGRSKEWVYGVVCKDKPDRCRVTSAVWHMVYTGHDGEERDEPGYTDRAATEAKLADLVRTSARVHAGLLPPEAAQPRRTLAELLADWHKYVAGGRASKKGAARQLQRATDVCNGIKASLPREITPTAVRSWITGRKAADRHKGKKFGSGTAGNYLTAIKSFTRWLAQVEKSESVDHLSALRKESDPTDVRVLRRALSPEELNKLLAVTAASNEVIYGLSGTERHALYLLACSTGLRAEELSYLTPASFTKSAVLIEAKRTKNKKQAEIPVEADVMAVVRSLFATGPVWPNRVKPSQAWWLNGARMIRRDLAATGIIARTDDGRVFDFHSLRGQFATDLDRAGVSLTRAQKLMRHSTPDLTSKHYTKPEQEELAKDVAKLRRPNLRANLTPEPTPHPSAPVRTSSKTAKTGDKIQPTKPRQNKRKPL